MRPIKPYSRVPRILARNDVEATIPQMNLLHLERYDIDVDIALNKNKNRKEIYCIFAMKIYLPNNARLRYA